MVGKYNCPDCQSLDIMYQEVFKKITFLTRIPTFVASMGLSAVGLYFASKGEGIWAAVGIILGFFLLYSAIFASGKPILAEINLRCEDCGHEWKLETPQGKNTKNFKTLPPSSWKKISDKDFPEMK